MWTRSSYIFSSRLFLLAPLWFLIFYALSKKNSHWHTNTSRRWFFYKLSLLLYCLSLSLSVVFVVVIFLISLGSCIVVDFFWLDATNTRIFCVWHWALWKKNHHLTIQPKLFILYTRGAFVKKIRWGPSSFFFRL